MKEEIYEKATYQIRLEGHLSEEWSEWFDGFSIVNLTQGEVKLTGEVPDQTALHSLLQRIRDLGITLIEVKRVDEGEDLEEDQRTITNQLPRRENHV